MRLRELFLKNFLGVAARTQEGFKAESEHEDQLVPNNDSS
jgi:hypothetical protein